MTEFASLSARSLGKCSQNTIHEVRKRLHIFHAAAVSPFGNLYRSAAKETKRPLTTVCSLSENYISSATTAGFFGSICVSADPTTEVVLIALRLYHAALRFRQGYLRACGKSEGL